MELHQPTTAAEAVALLAKHGDGAHFIAGGTAMVLLFKQRLLQAEHLVSLRGVAALRGVRKTKDGGLEIGAMVTHHQAETSPELARYNATLAEAFGHVATIRIRNQGTVGGNLVHADPAQDPPPVLLALEARLRIQGPGGPRTLPLDEFFTGYMQTALEPNELLMTVELPALPKDLRTAYVKYLPRTIDDYATVSVAAAIRIDDGGVCRHARVALGAAGTVPLRSRSVETALVGEKLTPARVAEVAELVLGDVDPLDDVRGSAGYKRDMARVWTARILARLVASPSGKTRAA